MKNPWKYSLFLLPILLFFFLAGFLCGRNWNPVPIVSTEITSKSRQITESEQQQALLLDINRATIHEFTVLPGIGEALATRIVEYRTENGPFPDCDSLLNVKGIGKDTLRKILPYITAGG